MKFNHYFRSSQEFSLKVTKLISVKTEVEQRSNCYLKAKASFLTLRSIVKKKGWGHLYKRQNCFTYNCLLRCTVFFWIDYMIHNLNLWKMLWENNSLPTCDTAVRVSALYQCWMASVMSTTGIFCCKRKFVHHQGGQTTWIHLGSHILNWSSLTARLTRLDKLWGNICSRRQWGNTSCVAVVVCSCFSDAFTFHFQPSTMHMLLCSHFVSFLFLCTFDLPFTILPL